MRPAKRSNEIALSEVSIYTDGACEPNPGAGGYGAILIHGIIRKELHGGFRMTTNNRMEIFAAIAALEALKVPCKVRLHSDSKYLVDAMALGWARRWTGYLPVRLESTLRMPRWRTAASAI